MAWARRLTQWPVSFHSGSRRWLKVSGITEIYSIRRRMLYSCMMPNREKIIEINKTAEDLFGYSREEMLNLTVQDFSSGASPYALKDALKLIHSAFKRNPSILNGWPRGKTGNYSGLKLCCQGRKLEVLDAFLLSYVT